MYDWPRRHAFTPNFTSKYIAYYDEIWFLVCTKLYPCIIVWLIIFQGTLIVFMSLTKSDDSEIQTNHSRHIKVISKKIMMMNLKKPY